MNPQVNPSVLAIDDVQVAYVCGHNVVIYNTENKHYRFIQGEFVFKLGGNSNPFSLYFNRRGGHKGSIVYGSQP